MKPGSQGFGFLLLFLLASSLFGKGAELVLVHESQPVASIQIGEQATSTESYAAKELQRAIRLISKADLPIVAGPTEEGKVAIVLGTPESNPDVARLAKQLGLNGADDQETVVRREGSRLYLAGQSPRAVLYAAYTFLEDRLGARWFWPGEDGEYLPFLSTIAVGAIDIRETASLRYGGLVLAFADKHHDEQTEVWMARNRMNFVLGDDLPASVVESRKQKGFFYRFGNHNITLDRAVLAKHPEYAAEVSGVRSVDSRWVPQLCWSNPEVKKLIEQKIIDYWDENPSIDLLTIYPPDNTRFCSCEACRKIGSVSTQWQQFAGEVISEVEKSRPGKKYGTIAYQAYREIPSGTPAPFDSIDYCLYNRCYRHLLNEDDPMNRRALAELKGWQEKGGKMGIYGYEFDMFNSPSLNDAVFVPLVSMEVDQLAYFHKTGITSFLTEIPPADFPKDKPRESRFWDCSRISLYALARAAWDADLSANQLVEDWMTRIYGPAAPPMTRYYWAIEGAWRQPAGHVTHYNNPVASYVDGFITPGFLKIADGCFAEARENLRKAGDGRARARIEKEIDLEGKMLDHWRSLYQLHIGRAQHLQGYAGKTSRDPFAAGTDGRVWENAGRLPEFVDAHDKPVADQTEVSLLWDETALYLRFVCHDAAISRLVAGSTKRDENRWTDDSVELFLQTGGSGANYFHLTANPKGSIYDARCVAGSFDKGWNPERSTAASIGKDRWTVDVTLPFSSFGAKPGKNTVWKASFKRTRPDGHGANSGWPDAYYHNPAGFGTLAFVEKPPKLRGRIVLYEAGYGIDSLFAELQKNHWNVVRESGDERALVRDLAQGAEGIVIRYPDLGGKGSRLSESFFKNDLQTYVRAGGKLLLSAVGPIPLGDWFPEAGTVKWSGFGSDPASRSTTFVQRGDWMMKPNHLETILRKGVVPATGYKPLSEGWDILAKTEMKNGDEYPYLLRRRIGKGVVVLTSSSLGYGGRHELFGDLNTGNTVKLIENLWGK